MKTIKLLTIATAVFLMSSCGGEAKHEEAAAEHEDVVESGIYKGKVGEVEADEKEIHVKIENGKDLELYFTDSTKLTKNGSAVDFKELAEGKNVEIEVKKVGTELEPVSVNIVE